MLDATQLAQEINKAIGVTDKDGNKIKVTEEMKTYAKAILTLTQATTAHAPGTVTGDCAPGSPLANGAAMNGLLIGFTPGPWLGIMSGGFPGAPDIAKEATASVGYINGAAKINFASGNITGTCTNTAEAPGPLVGGAGTDGTIDSLTGADWAKVVIPPMADAAMSKRIYDAIVKYINENAEVEYSSGSVTGTCPAAGGPLALGTAVGGVIS